MRTGIYIGGELYDAMVKVLGREPTREDVMNDLRCVYGVSKERKGKQKSSSSIVETNVATKKLDMDKLRAIMSGATVAKENVVTATASDMIKINLIKKNTGGFKNVYREDGEQYTAEQLFKKQGLEHLYEEYGK